MITSENLPQIIASSLSFFASLCWPIVVICIVTRFNKELKDLFHRVRYTKVTGLGEAAFKYPDEIIDKNELQSIGKKDTTVGKDISSEKFNWRNVGNIFWLGSDLMWTIDVILRGAPRNEIARGIRQSQHHLRSLGLTNTPFEARLSKLLTETENSLLQDWTDTKRNEIAKEILTLHYEIGILVENHQPDYKKTAN